MHRRLAALLFAVLVGPPVRGAGHGDRALGRRPSIEVPPSPAPSRRPRSNRPRRADPTTAPSPSPSRSTEPGSRPPSRPSPRRPPRPPGTRAASPTWPARRHRPLHRHAPDRRGHRRRRGTGGKHDGVKADRTFSARRSVASPPSSTSSRSATSWPTRTSLAVVPDEVIQLTPRRSRPACRASAAGSATVADIDGVDKRVDADVAIVDTGIALAPGPQRRRRLQLLDLRPDARGATRTTTARTSPGRSPPSTTASASSGSRRAPASGRSRSSTTAATA